MGVRLRVHEWVNAGTSVVNMLGSCQCQGFILSDVSCARNKVHCVNENNLFSVRLWFCIIADTFVKMKQVSKVRRPDVMYKLY